MKKYIKIALVLLMALMSSRCANFLSEVPDDRLQIDSPQKISELLANAYPAANYMEFTETMTDNVTDSEQISWSTTANTAYYNWDIYRESLPDSPNFYWDACYTAVSYANQALDEINKLGNPSSLNPQKGEALVARAYAHFMLVSLWSPRYNPATAAQDLGIPYVTVPETVLLKNYTRNSVAEVFDLIQKDLEEGLKYINDNYKQPKFHFNKAAAKAFATRFYLIKADWNKVIEYSNDLGNTPSAKEFFKVLVNNQNQVLPLSDQEKLYSDVQDPKNLLIVSVPSSYHRSFGTNRFQLTQTIQNPLFNNENARTTNQRTPDPEDPDNSWNYAPIYWSYSTASYNNGITMYIPKFSEYFKISNINSGTGTAYVNLVLFNNEEVFLNRIEAHVMTNQIALANQELTLLNLYLTLAIEPSFEITPVTEEVIISRTLVFPNEYTPFYTLNPLQMFYIKAIAKMRRVIFMHEGLRWWDIKRFGLEIPHTIYHQTTNVLLKNDNRKTLQIPEYALRAGLEKNPR